MIIAVDYILSNIESTNLTFRVRSLMSSYFFHFFSFFLNTIFIEFRNLQKSGIEKIMYLVMDWIVQIVRISFNSFNSLFSSLLFFSVFSTFFPRAAFFFSLFSSVENCVLDYTRVACKIIGSPFKFRAPWVTRRPLSSIVTGSTQKC